MSYKTVIGFYLPSYEGLSTSQVVEKIQKLSDHLASLYETYEWRIRDSHPVCVEDNGEVESQYDWISDLQKFKESFKDFASYISIHGSDDESGCCIVSDSSPRYESEGIDVEEGEFEFNHSFVIEEDVFTVYINTEVFYASELEHLPSANLGFRCDMNDIDGDYFEFTV